MFNTGSHGVVGLNLVVKLVVAQLRESIILELSGLDWLLVSWSRDGPNSQVSLTDSDSAEHHDDDSDIESDPVLSIPDSSFNVEPKDPVAEVPDEDGDFLKHGEEVTRVEESWDGQTGVGEEADIEDPPEAVDGSWEIVEDE